MLNARFDGHRVPGQLLAWALLGVCSAAAQEPPKAPERVPKLQASLDSVTRKESVVVLTSSSVRFRGRVVDVSETMLQLETARRTRDLPASDVIAVWRPSNRHWKRNLWIGTGVGAGLGVLTWAESGDCNDPTSICATEGPWTASDFATITALGAGFGALVSATHPGHAEPVYYADRPTGSALGWWPLEGKVYPGEWLEVRRRDNGEVLKGHLASFDANGVTLFEDPLPRTIPTDAIANVSRQKPSWWRLPLTAGLAGFYGSIVGAVACGDSDNCIGAVAGSFAAFYGTFGVFALKDLRRQAVLYDARSSGPPRQTMIIPILRRGGAGVQCKVLF